MSKLKFFQETKWHKRPGIRRERFLLVSLCSAFLCLSPLITSANSQETISVKLENATLSNVFDVIEQKTDYRFLYNVEDIQKAPAVTVNLENTTVEQILDLCFKNYPLTYQIRSKIIIIRPAMRKFFSMGITPVDRSRPFLSIEVSGHVTDQSGRPLEGVSVQVKGGSTGTSTDKDGRYTITISDDGTLIFSSIGYDQIEIKVRGQRIVDVTMDRTDQSLSEVVVTALGLERQKNTLPYAAQQISGDDVNQTNISNVASGLSGKVSGLEIRQGNAIGGSVNVVIRGIKSLTGNNQALFVVDGVPIDNSIDNTSSQQNGGGGYDYGNAAADINPDDILSINVLKGAAASALYGSRAANGVIMITTKHPKKGLGVTLNSGVSMGKIDKSTFVKYQNEYGAGRSEFYDKDGFLLSDVNGDGTLDLVVPTFAPRSWSYSQFDPNLMVYDWESFDPTSPNYQKPKPWIAAKHGPSDFYRTAVSNINNVMVGGQMGEQGSFKVEYTRNVDQGTFPNSTVQKDIVNFGASYNLSKKLKVSANANYSEVNGLGRYATGYDASRNVNSTFRHFGQVNVDVLEQKEAYFRTRQNITWNWADPTTPEGLKPGFYNNFYWNVYENFETDSRNRIFGFVSADYELTDWLHLMGRVSVDNYSGLQEERVAVGSIGVPSYSRFDKNFNELNYDLLGTVHKAINENFDLRALAGVNLRRNKISSIRATTSGGLVVPKLYAISNSFGTIPAPIETFQPKAVDGYFGGATLGYRQFLTLDATIRRDRSSTLPANANAYNYYGISGSWVFSKHLTSIPWLSSGKLRVNYATVGNDAPWGSIKDVYDKPNPFGNTLLFSLPSTKNNSSLRPERTKSKEIGLEMAFLTNRLGFDFTYYHTNSIDQIMPVAVSTATGYSSKFINAGDIMNHGIELSVFATPVRSRDFSWDINLNFSRNRNKVLSLYNDSKNLVLGSFQGGVTLNASVGKPYGELQSATYKMLDGQRLVKDNGFYDLTTTTSNVVGNVNPDWIGGIINTFRVKNFTLGFLVDVRQGGDLFSLDMYYGMVAGLYPETAGLNDLGNPKRDNVDDGGGIVMDGVTADGRQNTKRVTLNSNNSFAYPQSEYIYDASYIKLREASLSYAIPSSFLSKTKVIKNASLSLYGRNLWLIHKNVPYADPEENLSAGNIQGNQSGSYPTTRTIGLNLKLQF